MSELIVVRHAQASLFSDNYDQLSALGVRQAERLGAHWREHLQLTEMPTLAFSGPAERHRHTARLVLEALPGDFALDVIEHFDEHDGAALARRAIKDLAGDATITRLADGIAKTGDDRPARAKAYQRLYEEVMRRWIDGDYVPEGIETWPIFEARVLEGLTALQAAAAAAPRAVLFTSVGPTAVLLRHALRLDPHVAYALAYRQRNASVTRFLYSGDRFGLDAFNDVAHLPEPTSRTFR